MADVRAQAARALGERKVKEAVDPLVTLLDDREPAVRLQAVIALGADRQSEGRSEAAAPSRGRGLLHRLCDPASIPPDQRLEGGQRRAGLDRFPDAHRGDRDAGPGL